MTKLEKQLRAAWRQFGVPNDAAIVVAVSGGADSTALLDALARWRKRKQPSGPLFVAHLNHQLRGAESDEDEHFVGALAARLELPFLSERIAVQELARAHKQNLEAAARQARYDFLQRAAQQNRAMFILTAHTQDDQAETVLMRLLRGSGAEGLRGIFPQTRLRDGVTLLRPMLSATRADVLAHCQHYGLSYRTDSSNLSPDFTRNRIRQELLPLLHTFNPRVNETLARTAGLLAEEDAFLQQAATAALDDISAPNSLNTQQLQLRHPALRRRILRLWLRRERGDLQRIEAVHLTAIEALLAPGQSGRYIQLPGGGKVAREFDLLRFQAQAPMTQVLAPIVLPSESWQPFGEFHFYLQRHLAPAHAAQVASGDPDLFVAVLRECSALNTLQIRPRKPGDAYIPSGHSHTIKLKTLLIRHKIPWQTRDTYPVLATQAGKILWAPGLPIAREFAPDLPLSAESCSTVQDGSFTEPECALVVAERVRKD